MEKKYTIIDLMAAVWARGQTGEEFYYRSQGFFAVVLVGYKLTPPPTPQR
jgi:hypothetical protein